MSRFIDNNPSLDYVISVIVDEEVNKTLTKLKDEIKNLKGRQNSTNTDYVTGYISALSTLEGFIATLACGDSEEKNDC